MKTIVVYYSHTGNNEFLARRLAADLGCEAEAIVPRGKAFGGQLMANMLGLATRTAPLSRDLAGYDRVVLVGPIWMGRAAAPLRGFLKAARKKLRSLSFVSCCGSDDKGKDDTFGYTKAFDSLRTLAGGALSACYALPIGLVAKDGEQPNIMELRLDENSFAGAARGRYDGIVKELRG